MAYYKATEVLLKVDVSTSSTPQWESIGAIQTKNIDFKQDGAEVTNFDSAGRWREMLAGTGAKSISISGSGVLSDKPGIDKVRAAWRNGTLVNMQLIVPSDGTYTGPFLIPSFKIGAQHEGEATFDIDLESAGEITFAAAS